MSNSSLTQNKDHRGVVTLSINRPEIHNAFDDVLKRILIALTKIYLFQIIVDLNIRSWNIRRQACIIITFINEVTKTN